MSNLAYQVQPKRQQQFEPKTKPQTKVKKKRQITFGEKLLLSFLLILGTIGCTLIVINQATIFQYNNDIQTLEGNIANQEKINGGLEQEITELSKPERILKIATEQGLTIQNNNVQIIGH
ncbi:cell division protein FtsL [Calidifontibacillus oryziterrae]|uniref:cell division protein FtsL n=1 Tax=Calidifontibacillus oryziterrae TaxID=1191699 RepID=UPI00030EB612|nr:cell division protein FtsL [Calidifontibacillus oryziterrae]